MAPIYWAKALAFFAIFLCLSWFVVVGFAIFLVRILCTTELYMCKIALRPHVDILNDTESLQIIGSDEWFAA